MNRIDLANKYIEKNGVEDDTLPLFHVTAKVGWINDPNGFSVYDHKIHLFYQYHPYSNVWGPMHWGHVTSHDMIKWDHLDVALANDMPYDKDGCFSGSAIVKNSKHYLIYTSVSKIDGNERQTQSVAIGDGLHYQKYEYNPVVSTDMLIEDADKVHFRDPKVWFEDGRYWMVAGNKSLDGIPQILLYASDDCLKWEFVSILAKDIERKYGSMWECPDLLEVDGQRILIVSAENISANKYLHNGKNCVYFTGTYDKDRQIFDYDKPMPLDQGFDFYAATTTKLDDGRNILIAWMDNWEANIKPISQKWAGMLSLPREISFINGQLIQRPVRELDKYHGALISYHNVIIDHHMALDKISGRIADIDINILNDDYHFYKIMIACDDKHHVDITYHNDTKMMELDRTYCGMTSDMSSIRRFELFDKLTSLRMILDRYSCELFINDGTQCASMTYYTDLSADKIYFDGDNVSIDIKKYDITMK
ncbi:MAG: GH32 C-terminal domain-containing protein [Erysipelotrichaceae bacterium]|nr:GH32 C-terminal domain-containing protein [Erysipelotrichaceae bacterium]